MDHQFKLTANKDFIEEIRNDLVSSDCKVSEISKPTESTKYQLNLTDAASIVTIITGGISMAAFARSLYLSMKKKNRTIKIESPISKITIESKEDLSEEEIRQKISDLSKIV